MNHLSQHRRYSAIAAYALLLLGTITVPAAALQDRGDPVQVSVPSADYRCPLKRLGEEFVRCDHLTGNGVILHFVGRP